MSFFNKIDPERLSDLIDPKRLSDFVLGLITLQDEILALSLEKFPEISLESTLTVVLAWVKNVCDSYGTDFSKLLEESKAITLPAVKFHFVKSSTQNQNEVAQSTVTKKLDKNLN